MEQENKTNLQIKLEKYITDINPMNLVIGTDREYEHEIEMFLERAKDFMTENQLIELIRQVFKEMFNLADDKEFLDSYKKIVQEYISLSI
jgi:hypothetical protein